jgi:RNA 2',3'-cyclic 3'-phosphodiesterase
MEQCRIFLSIPIPAHFKAELVKQQEQLMVQGFRWTKPENLHITVAFIGEVPQQNLPDIIASLGFLSGYSPFTLQAKAIEPVARRGKVDMIWATFLHSPEFVNLATEASQILRLKKQKPVPHITLARSQRHGQVSVENADFTSLNDLDILVDKIELWQSDLQAGGARYSLVNRWGLF